MSEFLHVHIFSNLFVIIAQKVEAYLEPKQAYMMELFFEYT